jgi:hypothetical protein
VQGAILAIPWSRQVFKVTPLSSTELLPILMLSLLPIAAMELWKRMIRRKGWPGLLVGGSSST